MARLTYPTPPTGDQVDDYHGTPIADPYRPLEDGDAPATRAWIAAENELTERILDGVPGAAGDPRPAGARCGTTREPALRGAAATAGSSSGTPASRTRTSCGRPTRPRWRAPCSSTRTA